MDNRLLSITLSTIAVGLRTQADMLQALAKQLMPPIEPQKIWDGRKHALVDAIDFIKDTPIPITLAKGHTPVKPENTWERGGPFRD